MPSREQIRRALALIRKGAAQHDYFFEKLTSPAWLEPLEKAGLFLSPPSAIREGMSVSYPFWTASEYLARIASEAPEQVLSVMEKIPETDNIRVHTDLARAATALPGEAAERWARREIKWLHGQKRIYPPLPRALGALIIHLTSAGQPKTAMTLLRRVLAIREEVEAREMVGVLDTGHYDLLLRQCLPNVLADTQLDGLRHLAHTLNDALSLPLRSSDSDSRLWRPAVEDHEQNNNRRRDYPSSLVDAIRDGAEQLISSGLAFEEVVRLLLRFNKPIFKRIALHLLEVEGQHAHPIAKKLLLDRQNFLDDSVMHEYGRLLQVALPDMGSADRDKIFAWLEEGPSPREDDNEGDRLAEKKCWQRNRLHGLLDGLPEAWQARYKDLVGELGVPEYPDFLIWTTIRDAGPSTPLSIEELEKMTPEAIAEYLRNWEPQGGWESPTREGLGGTLRSAMTQSPKRFVGAPNLLEDLHPIYVVSLIEGLEGAIRGGHSPDDGSRILDFLSSASDDLSGQDTPPHAVNLAVATCLATSLNRDAIGIDCRKQAWQIIDALADNPHPTIGEDASSSDPMLLAEHSVRGKAMEAAVQYALWVHRAVTGKTAEAKEPFSMDSIREVRQRLERHLDPSSEQTRAVRAVFGRWYPWLLFLDQHWTVAATSRIFPPDNVAFQNSAWEAYITNCRAYIEPFRVLRSYYSNAVDQLKYTDSEPNKWYGSIGRKTGEHLMAMLWSGDLAWGDDNNLLGRFFANASLSEASHAIESVGRSLYGKDDVPSEILERLRVFWERLVEQVASGESDERTAMLQPFGWWFASGLFDDEWSFQQLTLVLQKAGGFELDSFVMVRLAELAEEEPELCLGALETLFALNNNFSREVLQFDWEGAAQVILQRALRNERTAERSRNLIHQLGTRSYRQYRELLDANTPKKELRKNFSG